MKFNVKTFNSFVTDQKIFLLILSKKKSFKYIPFKLYIWLHNPKLLSKWLILKNKDKKTFSLFGITVHDLKDWWKQISKNFHSHHINWRVKEKKSKNISSTLESRF